MEFSCQVRHLSSGSWLVRHDGADVGTVEVTAATRDAAVEKMRRELQYRLELCPCTGEMYRHVDIRIAESH
jgi:hypothetical protein